jgi:hypothetical protein
MNYSDVKADKYELRLEAVTTSVGFDDLLDFTLSHNHQHFDSYHVVTSHDDVATQRVGMKHGCTVITTDAFKKNGRNFNKGAAINAGFGYWQYHGWRMHIDSDIALPDKFRQTLFNHSHLEYDCLYGADRLDIVGKQAIRSLREKMNGYPQHRGNYLVDASLGNNTTGKLGGRLVRTLDGYHPIGYFQLWHCSTQRQYPFSLGTAAGDDVLFSGLYPVAKRRLLPSVVVYHICPSYPRQRENWDGHRKQERLD